ncbi:hypothetical protein ACLB1G_19730 [Oxalobacteraceae bacterium A2-2]
MKTSLFAIGLFGCILQQLVLAANLAETTNCIRDNYSNTTFPERLPPGPPFRIVQTQHGITKVSLLDGYRIHFDIENKYQNADIKIEQSDPEKFHQDKINIKAQFYFIKEKNKNNIEINEISRDNIDIFNISLKEGTGLGKITTIFSNTEKIIATIYFFSSKNSNSEKTQLYYENRITEISINCLTN